MTVGFGLGLETAVAVGLGLFSEVGEGEKDPGDSGFSTRGSPPSSIVVPITDVVPITEVPVDPGVRLDGVISRGASVVSEPSGASRAPAEAAAITTETVRISPIASSKIVR